MKRVILILLLFFCLLAGKADGLTPREMRQAVQYGFVGRMIYLTCKSDAQANDKAQL